MPEPWRRAYRFFDRLIVVESDTVEAAEALDAVYARQRAPPPGGADEPDLHIRVLTGDEEQPPGGGAAAADRPRGERDPPATPHASLDQARERPAATGPRIEVGGRTVRVPDVSQLVHYAHLVLVNAAAALVTDSLVLHSGAVARDGRAVLLVGYSGAGKTTLTLELVRRGWGFLSDDFAVLEANGMVRPFPRRVSLTDESLALLGLPTPARGLRLAGFGGREKFIVDVENLYPGHLAAAAPIGALFLLAPPGASDDLKTLDEGAGQLPAGELPVGDLPAGQLPAAEPSATKLPPGEHHSGQLPATQSGAAVWRLHVDHLPAGLLDALAALPGVQSVRRGADDHQPVLELAMTPGARVVTGLDAVCARLDVTVLAAQRTTVGRTQGHATSVTQRDFTRPPSAARLTRTQAAPELLAHALSVSGRRFLVGTSEVELLKALAIVRGALAGDTAVLRLRSGPLHATADVVERVVAGLGQPSAPSAMAPANHVLAQAADLWRRSGSVGRVTVKGESMAPLLADGDTVRVRAGLRVRLGDIVVARTSGGLVTHRVLALQDGRVVLRGDNAPAADPPLPPEAILGRVTAVEPGGKLARRFDLPLARTVAVTTAGYARLHAAARRGPRPKHLPAAALRIERCVLPPMSAEDAFVLLTARVHVADHAAQRARALIATGLDWDAVAHRAWLGQLGPLAYGGVQQLGPGAGVPQPLIDRLRALYAGNWARSRRLHALLVETLALLESEGLEVLAHKGAALSAAVFSDAANHISGDIDLSVRDADRRRAESVTHAVRQPLADAFPTRREPDACHIELDGTAHHDVEPALFGAGRWQTERFDWEAIWRRARRVSVDGRSMLVPCPADLILTLAANAVRRGFTPVRVVADIAEAIAHFDPDIDWQCYAHQARATHFDRRSWIVLGLAADWFDAPVPAHMLEPPQRFRPAAYERWLLEVKRRRPFARLPTRVLWAGSMRRAGALAIRLAWSTGRRRWSGT